MEKLVIMDDYDKNRWQEITDKYKESQKNPEAVQELKKITAKFWFDMIEKYPILYNKHLSINDKEGFIFSWVGVAELRRTK